MMSTIVPMQKPEEQTLEWQRIEILAQCLLETKPGEEPSNELLEKLQSIQTRVKFLRNSSGMWNFHSTKDLTPYLSNLALDLLAATYAPHINPNVALLYQDLQQNCSIYPTIAFLYRLFALTDEDYISLRQLSDKQGILVSNGLLQINNEGPLLQLKPHPVVLAKLSGLPHKGVSIPGATQISMEATWSDLVVPDNQRKALHEYMLWVQHGHKVVRQWGGKPIYGPVGLFSGPSGTGKTYTASVIANQLNLELHRVDLGSLVSKYIGETEKNLNALFDSAQGQPVLLQFDEVDALMGKRGEIKEAHHRYANMQVSHLLSRIEQYQGPCILTTNLRKQIDHAFQRRFHFVISFSLPDVSSRIALWKLLLPPNAPMAKNIDLRMVAEAVALTGGEIRNAANHAAVLALAESMPIGLEHLALGIWRVLQKNETQAELHNMRNLAHYLPKDIISGERL